MNRDNKIIDVLCLYFGEDKERLQALKENLDDIGFQMLLSDLSSTLNEVEKYLKMRDSHMSVATLDKQIDFKKIDDSKKRQIYSDILDNGISETDIDTMKKLISIMADFNKKRQK